ncbi:alpha/beta fold hydrolase [Pseudomonas sp. NA-150]|uniref:alpha/beta fold hydrolase n=1 Tax=Pseudomonas sp. NA-150 TaxID=3367525 RepID=UPI0037C9DEE9
MPFITIEQQTLHYQIHGTGFPIVLGHSYLWDSTMWAPQIEALSEHYQVIVPDLWGHGQSGPLPEGTQTLGDLATHVSALLDALDIKQCAVIGLSVGGMWGAELALREPERIKALIMMDTSLDAEPEASHTRYFQMLDAIGALGTIPAPMLDAILPLFFHAGSALDQEVHSRFRHELSRFSADQLRQSVVPLGRIVFGRPDTTSQLAGLNPATTLLMCGALDMARPPEETFRMAEIIGCKYVLIPEAGHISNLENPSFVTDTLLEWLQQNTPV